MKGIWGLVTLSPNAEEALSLLSISSPITRESVEVAAARFLELGEDNTGPKCVIIRSGALGAYVATKTGGGQWVDAFWTAEDSIKVVDVTGEFKKDASDISLNLSEFRRRQWLSRRIRSGFAAYRR